MWNLFHHVLKENGVVCLTSSQPFTSKLIISNLKEFKYEWIWIKNQGSNFATLKYQPMKEHENMLHGEVNIDELMKAPEDDIKFVSVRRLIKIADLDLAQLPSLSSRQRRQTLTKASKKLTKMIQKIWRQQDVEISLELSGPNGKQLNVWVSCDKGPDRYPENQGSAD